MLQNLTGMHALVILAIVLLLFGASKLPTLAKSVGQSVRILRKESAEDSDDSVDSGDSTGAGSAGGTDEAATAVGPRVPVTHTTGAGGRQEQHPS